MKIAIFSDTFLPQINGVITATIMLAKELTRQGHEIHVLAPYYKDYQGDADLPFPVKRFAAFPAWFYEDFKWAINPNPAILAYVRKHDFDVLHFQVPMALGHQAISIAKFLRKPIVGTFHTFFADPDYLKHIKIDGKIIEKIGWIYSNAHYNRCDVVTVPSIETGKELKQRKCKPPIRYISNGIDLSQFDNSKADEVRANYNIQDDDIVFLFIGRLAYEKNLKALITAFNQASSQDSRLKLLIVGGGPQEEEYFQLVNELGETARTAISFTGRIEHNDLVVSGIFGAADFFISLSKTENQPVTILESQANGLIPICLPEKGLKSMIEHEKTGYFLSSEKPEIFTKELFSLINDPQKLDNLHRGINEFIEGQDIRNIAQEWVQLYTELIEQE